MGGCHPRQSQNRPLQDPSVIDAVYNNQAAVPFGPRTQVDSFNQLKPTVAASSAVAIRPDALILRDTVTVAETAPGSSLFVLEFEYIAKCDCSISIYQFAEVRQSNNAAASFYVDTSQYPQPLVFPISPTPRSRFPAVSIDMRRYPAALYEFKNRKNYPLILDITPQYAEPKPPQSHTTYLMYQASGQGWSTVVVRQVFTLNGVENLLQDLFGMETQEGSSECVVCLAEKKEVAIIPCRHVCLCTKCAELITTQQSSNCPMCRGPVQSYMRLQVS